MNDVRFGRNGRDAKRWRLQSAATVMNDVAISGRSLMSMNACYSAPVRVRCIVINSSVCTSVCLSASISLEPPERPAWNFVCRSPVVVARSSSDGVPLRYVLPVLWMTSRLAVISATRKGGGCTSVRLHSATAINDVAIPRRCLVSWCLWMLVWPPDILVDGLMFYHGFFSFFAVSSPSSLNRTQRKSATRSEVSAI